MYCLEAYAAARIEHYQMLSKLDLEHFKSNIMLLVQEDKNLCNLNPRYYSLRITYFHCSKQLLFGS